ncbi:hypothetical protein SFRURICE_021464 [Spodoptera frugiperda]|nr:hypothetical protein SFRURICE_021464 [Spodoptera frugiperda]
MLIGFENTLVTVVCDYLVGRVVVSATTRQGSRESLVGGVVANKDYRTRGLGFDSRVGQSIVGLFSHEVLNCAQYMAIGITPYYMGLITQIEKVDVHCKAALRAVIRTSVYPFGDKKATLPYTKVFFCVVGAFTNI